MSRNTRDDLDPDRTRVRAQASQTPSRATPREPLDLGDMSLDMSSSVPRTAPKPEQIEEEQVSRPAPRPTGSSSLTVTLSAASAILLAIALAAVVVIGQRRITGLNERLNATTHELSLERTARTTAEQRIEDLNGELAAARAALKDREASLSNTVDRAESLKRTGDDRFGIDFIR